MLPLLGIAALFRLVPDLSAEDASKLQLDGRLYRERERNCVKMCQRTAKRGHATQLRDVGLNLEELEVSTDPFCKSLFSLCA